MKKIKLSVAMATFNEEPKIRKTLDSVADWVDEIVIVDGSSSDKTREIAKRYHAKIIKTTNKPIFHINKQAAINKCKNDWILQLDGDEVVSPELKDEIVRIVRQNNNKAAAFYLPRKNYFMGKWLKKTGQYPDYVIRLFQKGRAFLPCKSVHEQMVVRGKTCYLSGHLLHYPYQNFSEYLQKSDRYTTLDAVELSKSGQKPSVLGLIAALLKFKITFWKLFLRHKGFLDGIPGFVFSFYSGLHILSSYIKFYEKDKNRT